MKILLSGASGFIGSKVSTFLQQKGHEVIKLVRTPTQAPNEAFWDPQKAYIDPTALENLDAVINLAGENISDGRWTAEKKERILTSRISTTLLLAYSIGKLEKKPKVMINASAVGIYGNKWDVVVDEDSYPGVGFLAEVCHEWENATLAAQQAGIRVVLLRMGVVLSSEGGALKKMLTPFKLGLGGKLGAGQQYMSWICIDDLLEVMQFILQNESISGPVNAVTPNPVKNEEFTKSLGKVLHRPTFFKVPETVLRLILGEMADEMLLSSTRAMPKRLTDASFKFKYPYLEDALKIS